MNGFLQRLMTGLYFILLSFNTSIAFLRCQGCQKRTGCVILSSSFSVPIEAATALSSSFDRFGNWSTNGVHAPQRYIVLSWWDLNTYLTPESVLLITVPGQLFLRQDFSVLPGLIADVWSSSCFSFLSAEITTRQTTTSANVRIGIAPAFTSAPPVSSFLAASCLPLACVPL